MRRSVKIWLIIAASLVLIGCVLFGGVMFMLKWDFANLSSKQYETNEHEINEGFQAISVKADTAVIHFVPSENGKCSVVCYEQKNAKHSVSVKDGTLVIEVVDTQKWYERIGINFKTPKVTVYLPQGEYGALSIESHTGDVEISADFRFESIAISASTGDIRSFASAMEDITIKTTTGHIFVENLSARSLSLSVSTGKVTASSVSCEGDVSVGVTTGKTYLSDISCKTLVSRGSTGDISLNHVVAKDKLSIKRSTGDVTFDGCDAAEIFVETDTGDVKGSFLSEKVFLVNTDTGRKEVPNTVTGGRCEITTDTGNIILSIE